MTVSEPPPAQSAESVAALDAAAFEAQKAWRLAQDVERQAHARYRAACDACLLARRNAGLLARSEQSDGPGGTDA